MAQKVTLKEIAREVGLSPTSVSLVLNNRPCKVSEENKRRIREVARKKRYVPNQIARSLVMQHSKTLGLVVPNIESRFFSSLAKSLELRCRKLGYALFIMNSDESEPNDAELVRLLVNRGVDGLFIVASDEFPTSGTLREDLEQLPVPYVMVDRYLDDLSCDKVRFDNERGGYLATRHLTDRGHRRIACIVNTRSHTGRERLAGYERALREAGVEPDPALELLSGYYIADAYEAASALAGADVTAVFASSDNIALGLLRRLADLGVAVPDACSVVSYDNSAADVLFTPALTSIEQNVGELSDAAVEMMMRRLREEEAAGEQTAPVERLLPPRLIEKDSVMPLV